MGTALRPATPWDFDALSAIAAMGGSPDGDDRYFEFVRSHGLLTVAVVDAVVVGFAGAIPVDGGVFVSDLFVDPACRSAGIGRQVLHAVLRDQAASCTFSSIHPAALHLYAAFGMTPGERLLTLQGVGSGSGPPLSPGPWRHARPELVSHFSRSGAIVTAQSVVRRAPGAVEVWRVDGPDPRRALAEVIAASSPDETVTVSMLESDPLVEWLQRQGFGEIDSDVWCRSTDGLRAIVASCVHRGLC